MKTQSVRGEVVVLVLLGISLFTTGGWAWTKMTASDRNRKVATQAAQVAEEARRKAEQAQQEATQARDSAARAQAAAEHERKLHDQADQAASGFVEGAKIAIQANPTPTQADLVALGLLENASTALGQPLTDAQRKVWVTTVAGLIAKQADAEARVAQLAQEAVALRAQLGEARTRAQAAEAQTVQLTQELTTTNQQLVTTTGKAAHLTDENRTWAERGQTLWGRLKAGAVLLGVCLVALLALGWRHWNLGGTLTDSIAWAKNLEDRLDQSGQQVAKEFHDWMEGDLRGMARINKVKKKLRL